MLVPVFSFGIRCSVTSDTIDINVFEWLRLCHMSDEAIPIRNLQQDLLRWCMVVPFYCGMLLTSILALKPGEKYTITLYDFWEAWGSNMVGKSPDDHEWQYQWYLTEKPASTQENGTHVSGHRPSEQQSLGHVAHWTLLPRTLEDQWLHVGLHLPDDCRWVPWNTWKKQQQIKTVQLGWAWCPSGYVGSSFTYGIGKEWYFHIFPRDL